MSNIVSFISGTIFAAYIAQTYDIVNIKKNIYEYILANKNIRKIR